MTKKEKLMFTGLLLIGLTYLILTVIMLFWNR
ncbi:hypothetical protein ANDSL2ph1_CDS0018 [Acetoanaerobium phage ANDSL2_ph1]